MKLQDVLLLRRMAQRVGDFIRYWGFRRIHGEIWTLVYLSRKPLSGAELVDLLDVSKALVSPALKELECEGLIIEVPSENAKVKRYSAVPDVGAVIKRVLKSRETKMMDHIQTAFTELDGSHRAELSDFVDPLRKQAIGQMIQTAHFSLSAILELDLAWSNFDES